MERLDLNKVKILGRTDKLTFFEKCKTNEIKFNFFPKLNQSELNILEDLSFHTRKLCNIFFMSELVMGLSLILNL